MSELRIAVIVVTHNSEKWLEGFFRSWLAADTAHPIAHEIVVADSGSDESPEVLCRKLCPSARVVLCGNVGYGAAINRGVAMTSAPWVLLCNPDITFETGFLKAFDDFMSGRTDAAKFLDGCGLVAPLMENQDGSKQLSIGKFPCIVRLMMDQLRSPERRKYSTVVSGHACPVDWATGACLLVRRRDFDAIRGFDEKFFLYVEEVDFQRRLRSAGRVRFFNPALRVTHHAPAAMRDDSVKIKKYAARGLLRYFAKHGSWGQLFWFRVLGVVNGRLSVGEGFAKRGRILERGTGP